MKKVIIGLLFIPLLGVSCNFLSKSKMAGVMKTINGGADWEFVNVLSGGKTGLEAESISVIRFDPKDDEHIFAGSYAGGIFQSKDGGKLWERILSKIFVFDIVVDYFDPKIIYTSGSFGGHAKILKSVDGGGSWQEIYNDAETGNTIRTLSINPKSPSQILAGSTSGSLLLSTDAGETWRLVKAFKDDIRKTVWHNTGLVYVLFDKYGLYKTSDMQEFSELTQSITKNKDLLALNLGNTVGKFNQVWVDEEKTGLLYITTEKGMYRSFNDGASWDAVKLPSGKAEPFTRAVVVLKGGMLIYTSIAETVYKTNDGGQSWQTQNLPITGFVNFLAPNPSMPQIVYAGIYLTK